MDKPSENGLGEQNQVFSALISGKYDAEAKKRCNKQTFPCVFINASNIASYEKVAKQRHDQKLP